jgi:hypothetical protein
VAGALFLFHGFCVRRLKSGASPPAAAAAISEHNGSDFLFVVAMIVWAIGDIVGTFLRDLDVLARQPHDPKSVYRFAQYIFKTFGMATREINNIGKATVQSQRASKTSSKHFSVGGAP